MIREEFYYGLKKIAARLGLSENMTRKLCKDGVIIAHQAKTKGLKQTWYCNETEIIKTIREQFPERL